MSATRPLLTYLRHSGSATPALSALVPVVEPARWTRPATHFPQPNPSFVTQLIANAEQLAQRGACLRERAADALSAYRARQHGAFGAGLRTRQTI